MAKGYVSIKDDVVVWLGESQINQSLCLANITTKEWEEVKEPVTWKEAFEAGLEGKKIKPDGQYLTYTDYEELHYALAYLGERPGYYQNLTLGKWYIE